MKLRLRWWQIIILVAIHISMCILFNAISIISGAQYWIWVGLFITVAVCLSLIYFFTKITPDIIKEGESREEDIDKEFVPPELTVTQGNIEDDYIKARKTSNM